MSSDAAAYLLLGLGLLAVAVLLALPVLAVWWLVGAPRPLPPVPLELFADDAATADGRVLRRCESCGVLWKGRPGEDAAVLTLRLRRWVRRRTRAKKSVTPSWARRRGWRRCPSCFSTKVRSSRAARTSA